MDPEQIVIGLIVVLALAVLLGLTAAVKTTIDCQRRKRRRTGLEEIGIRMGFKYMGLNYECEPQRQDEAEWYLFGYIDGPVRNILRGAAAGTEVVIFDCNIWAHQHRSHSRTVAAYRLHPSVPEFELWRNVGIRRLLGPRTMGFIQRVHYVNFGSNKDFSDRYVVRGDCEDEHAIRAFFNPEMLDYFSSLDPNNNYCFATGCGWIGFCKWERMPEPAAMPAFLDEMSSIYTAIKSRMSGSALAEGV